MSIPTPSTNRPWNVLKFGGSSVSTLERWERIAAVIRRHLERGRKALVVTSAVKGVSNQLEAVLAELEAGTDPSPTLHAIERIHCQLAASLDLEVEEVLHQELGALHAWVRQAREGRPVDAAFRAQVMSLGELMSTRLGARWLRAQGLPVQWMDARGMLESEADASGPDGQGYLSATCSHAHDPELGRRLDAAGAEVVLTQGFIARNAAGETVLLGRGGSDTSAAYLAARIGAETLEIWTDVPGMFTANPYDLDGARLLQRLSYDDAEVLACMGGKVLHPRCLQPVREHGIPLRIGWTERPDVEGTRIGPARADDHRGIKAVSSRQGLCMISMQRPFSWQPVGFMAEVASCFHRHGLSMDLLASSPSDIRATVDFGAFPGARDAMESFLCDLRRVCEPTVRYDLASVSLVGSGIRSELHRLGAALPLLRGRDVYMVAHAGNDACVSYVVDASDADELVYRFHGRLFERLDVGEAFGPAWRELSAEAAPRSARHPSHRGRVVLESSEHVSA